LILGFLTAFILGGAAVFGGVTLLGGDSAEESSEKSDSEGGKGEDGESSASNPDLFNLGLFTVNLHGPGGGGVVRMEIQVQTDASLVENLEELKPQFRQAIITIVSEYSYSDLEGLDGKTRLADELLTRLNRLVENGRINRLYFVQFAVQGRVTEEGGKKNQAEVDRRQAELDALKKQAEDANDSDTQVLQGLRLQLKVNAEMINDQYAVSIVTNDLLAQGCEVVEGGASKTDRLKTTIYAPDHLHEQARVLATLIPGGAEIDTLTWAAKEDVVIALGDSVYDGIEAIEEPTGGECPPWCGEDGLDGLSAEELEAYESEEYTDFHYMLHALDAESEEEYNKRQNSETRVCSTTADARCRVCGHCEVFEPTPEEPPSAAAAELKEEFGELRFNSLPWSNIAIDGEPNGRTGKPIELTVGLHQVVLTTADGRQHEMSVTIRANKTETKCWNFDESQLCYR